MKISKEKLTFLKNAHIITLELIHDMLEVKQHINNYQRNTNKKYGLNIEKDEVINKIPEPHFGTFARPYRPANRSHPRSL